MKLGLNRAVFDTTHVTGNNMKMLFGIMTLAAVALSGNDDSQSISVLNQDPQPILRDQGPAVVAQETVLEKPIVAAPEFQAPALEQPVPLNGTFADPVVGEPWALHGAAVADCTPCRRLVCRCKRTPKTEISFQLIDPTGCIHEACVKVPVCCLDKAPQVTWKDRLFGRQVATLCWECCDHEAKVIVTRKGKVRVRD